MREIKGRRRQERVMPVLVILWRINAVVLWKLSRELLEEGKQNSGCKGESDTLSSVPSSSREDEADAVSPDAVPVTREQACYRCGRLEAVFPTRSPTRHASSRIPQCLPLQHSARRRVYRAPVISNSLQMERICAFSPRMLSMRTSRGVITSAWVHLCTFGLP